jgi:hypothetical protein
MAETDQHIAVALSGGGHRASLFGLGALLYLVDARKGPELSTVSSISGGSLTNGYVGLTSDLTTATSEDVWRDMQPFASQVASRGTVFASPLTIALLAGIAVCVLVPLVLSFLLPAAAAIAAWVVGLAVAGLLAQQRSRVTAHAFDRAVFKGRTLEDMHSEVTHVVCAADIQTAETVYFSSRFVHAWRLGWGVPGGLPVARAVQASAALPGAFSIVRLNTGRHRFADTSGLSAFKLTDGGAYDNMGTEWPMRLARRLTEGTPPSPPLAGADTLIVVNASAGQGVVERRSVNTPLLGEITTLLAVKDVLYDQTTAVRRRLLDFRFRATRGGFSGPDGNLNGTLAQIDRSPFDLPDAFAGGTDDLATRAKAAIEHLGGDAARDGWKADVKANRGVKTGLSKIPADRAAALVRHAYVLTMVNAHVLLDHDLLPVPDEARFRALVT